MTLLADMSMASFIYVFSRVRRLFSVYEQDRCYLPSA